MTTQNLSVVILAGGLATRLRPLTETIPKSLIAINDEPFIAHQLRLLRQNNINHVVLCVGYLGNQIKDYIGNGKQFGLEVTYSFDGPLLLGTAGAIKQALPLLSEDFFVLYGDSYLPCSFSSVATTFFQKKKLALMTVFHNQGQWDKSNIEFNEGKIQKYDKKNQTDSMHFIDYGLGIFNKAAFQLLSGNEPYDLATLYQLLLKQEQLAAHEVTERFYEVGSFAGISQLSYYLLQKHTKEFI